MDKIVDLSMTFEEGMQTFAAHWHPFYEITQLGRHGIENRETKKIVLGTHTGTHIDAPRHFIPGGETIENISLEVMYGRAVIVDFSWVEEKSEIGVEELEKHIPEGEYERIILRFDWDKHLGTNKYYSDHPFLSTKACMWLVEKGCRLLAMDTPQPDNPVNNASGEIDAPDHKILLGNGVLIVEYLVNIVSVQNDIVTLVVAPLKIKNGDGAPARCFVIE